MDLNEHKGKIAIFAVTALIMIIVLAVSLARPGPESSMASEELDDFGENEGSALSPAALAQKCDDLAAFPGDPNRMSAPVNDDSFATAAALSACRAALAVNTENPRIMFNLGRSLYLAGQYAEAHQHLKASRLAGYPAASLLLGMAYRDGNLPSTELANLNTAIALFDEAVKGGIEGAASALLDAEQELDRSIFEKSLFQNGDYMEKLYVGEFKNTEFPLSLLYYMRGIAAGFEDGNVIFIDQACKPLLSKAGIDLLNSEAVEAAVILAGAMGSQDAQGNWTPKGILGTIGSNMAKDYVFDQGVRDSTILYNEDGRYGCKSEVTRKILSNMMIVIKNTH